MVSIAMAVLLQRRDEGWTVREEIEETTSRGGREQAEEGAKPQAEEGGEQGLPCAQGLLKHVRNTNVI